MVFGVVFFIFGVLMLSFFEGVVRAACLSLCAICCLRILDFWREKGLVSIALKQVFFCCSFKVPKNQQKNSQNKVW